MRSAPGPLQRRRLIVAGLGSGFAGTATTMGGPPIALAYAGHSSPTLRATLGAFFATGLAVSCVVLAAVGEFGPTQLLIGLALTPFVLFGWLLSRPLARRVDAAGGIRAALTIVCAAAALVLLGQTAWNLAT